MRIPVVPVIFISVFNWGDDAYNATCQNRVVFFIFIQHTQIFVLSLLIKLDHFLNKDFSIKILIGCIRSLSMKWYLNWLSKWSSFSRDVKINSHGTNRENKNNYCNDCRYFQEIDALWFFNKSKLWSWREMVYVKILCRCRFFITPGLILVGPFHIWRCWAGPRIVFGC